MLAILDTASDRRLRLATHGFQLSGPSRARHPAGKLRHSPGTRVRHATGRYGIRPADGYGMRPAATASDRAHATACDRHTTASERTRSGMRPACSRHMNGKVAVLTAAGRRESAARARADYGIRAAVHGIQPASTTALDRRIGPVVSAERAPAAPRLVHCSSPLRFHRCAPREDGCEVTLRVGRGRCPSRPATRPASSHGSLPECRFARRRGDRDE